MNNVVDLESLFGFKLDLIEEEECHFMT
jgi:hypothetical protein